MPRASAMPALCLVAQSRPGDAWRDRMLRVLEAASPATLVLTGASNLHAFDIAATRALVEMAQTQGIAALIADSIDVSRDVAADGVHLSWRPEIEDAYEAARNALGPDAIVGADAGVSRHDAMAIGEAGADYVAFGRNGHAHGDDASIDDIIETQRTLVTWWSEIFVVPVVAFDAASPADVEDLAQSGAEFVAVRLPDEASTESDLAWASALRAALARPVRAA